MLYFYTIFPSALASWRVYLFCRLLEPRSTWPNLNDYRPNSGRCDELSESPVPFMATWKKSCMYWLKERRKKKGKEGGTNRKRNGEREKSARWLGSSLVSGRFASDLKSALLILAGLFQHASLSLLSWCWRGLTTTKKNGYICKASGVLGLKLACWSFHQFLIFQSKVHH